jgi:alpha-tubulin suppressor-like RCC1 family protein
MSFQSYVQERTIRGAGASILTVVLLGSAGCGSDSTGPGAGGKPAVGVALAVGQQFGCALTADGKSYCWGDNLRGQLGDSSFIPSLVPVPTAGGHRFVAIAAGPSSACALDGGGVAWCWGDDPIEPGVPLSYRTTPVAVSSPRPLMSITVGAKFGCGLSSDGAAFCWGINSQGQLGVGDTLGRPTATAVQTSVRFTSIVADFFSTCGLTSAGAAWCWGDNSFGELGTGDKVAASTPRAVSGVPPLHLLSSGPIHECGLTATNDRYCWGSNTSGQLGDGGTTARLVPGLVTDTHTYTIVRSSRANSILSTTCGIDAAGDVYCWGYNSKGQLGTGAGAGQTCNSGTLTVCVYTPTKVAGVSNAVAIDVGLEQVCALTSKPQILCWGEGVHGELGDGTGVASATPVLVTGNLPLP